LNDVGVETAPLRQAPEQLRNAAVVVLCECVNQDEERYPDNRRYGFYVNCRAASRITINQNHAVYQTPALLQPGNTQQPPQQRFGHRRIRRTPRDADTYVRFVSQQLSADLNRHTIFENPLQSAGFVL
jgi:hypothetical protein